MVRQWTDRERIAHLLRRLGMGASTWELDELVPMGFDKALERIIDSSGPDLSHPFRFAFREKEDAETGPYRFVRFWILQCLTTKTPFREKLSLFLHDHLAVNAESVSNGLQMLEYIQEIRKNPGGRFGDTLSRVVKSSAFLESLNVEMKFRDVPNENFARELLELYTVGIGHYTESDIKEIARALTGWSYEVLYYQMQGEENGRLKRMLASGTPSGSFSWLPAVHDRGEKTIFGKKANWTGDQVLEMLANHPTTARHLCEKLWSFFGSSEPKENCIDAMVKEYVRTKGELKSVVRVMAKHPDFWAEDVVRRLIKSPFDYAFGMTRSMNSMKVVVEKFDPEAPPTKPMDETIHEATGALAYFLEQMGQDLFWPPSVAGWDWHASWISTANVLQRKRFRGIFTWEKYDDKGKEQWRPSSSLREVMAILRRKPNRTGVEFVNNFCQIFDCELGEDKAKALAERIDKSGILQDLGNDGWLGGTLSELGDLVFFSPEYQVC